MLPSTSPVKGWVAIEGICFQLINLGRRRAQIHGVWFFFALYFLKGLGGCGEEEGVGGQGVEVLRNQSLLEKGPTNYSVTSKGDLKVEMYSVTH